MGELFKRISFIEVAGKRINTRINFSVIKTDGGTPSKCRCKVYNLSPSSRSLLEDKKNQFILKTGYRDVAEILFIGDINSATTSRNGPDLITEIQSGDGERSLANAHIDIGLGPGATNKQVLELIKKSLGISIGAIRGFPDKTYTNGFCFSGSTQELLINLQRDARPPLLVAFDWSIRDNELQILPPGGTTTEEAVHLSPDTGMIGTPTKTEEGFKVESLLNTKLAPGRRVLLRTTQLAIAGEYKISKVEHKGDSYKGVNISVVQGVSLG